MIIRNRLTIPTCEVNTRITFEEAVSAVLEFAQSEEIPFGYFSHYDVERIRTAARLISEKRGR